MRFYQRRRLLDVPAKTARGRRSYGPAALRDLRFIRRCQGLGLSLDEVGVLLRMKRAPSRPCEGVHGKSRRRSPRSTQNVVVSIWSRRC